MRREIFLPCAALALICGNLATYSICSRSDGLSPAPSVLAGTCLILILLILFLRVPRSPFRSTMTTTMNSLLPMVAFAALGSIGAACQLFFLPTAETSCLRESNSLQVSGCIVRGGLSSSGRPYIEVSMQRERTIIYNLPQGMHWSPGDSLTATVRCSRVRDFSPDFDYVAHMRSRGIFYTCVYSRYSGDIRVKPAQRLKLRHLPAILRQHFSFAVDRLIPDPAMAASKAVIKALAYGYQDEIPEDIEAAFRNSGAVHLLALSGMHLGLLYAAIVRVLGIFGNSPGLRKLRSCLTILCLWAYTIFTGCGISILRAAVMFSIYEMGSLFGRRKHGLNSMALSAIIIATVDPSAPSQISFQLSYAAMVAIFLIFPHLQNLVKCRNRLLVQLRDICAMTIACQTTTAPIILLHFGTFAFFSLISNILCSPLVSLAMLLIPVSFIFQDVTGSLVFIIDIFIHINTIISQL